MMNFHVVTIFPELINTYVNESVIGRARKDGRTDVHTYDPRDFTDDKHRSVDDEPYGGGPGMVMQAEPILKAVSSIKANNPRIFILSPHGKQFTNVMAEEFSKEDRDVVLIAGRYEGIDARVKEALNAEELSVGPYTLTGGELPALIVVDAVARRISGVLGDESSVEERRVASKEVYTRPEVLEWQGREYRVPEVLLSGDHKRIEEWRGRS